MLVTVFFTYVLGLLHVQYTSLSVLIHYIVYGVLLYVHNTPPCVPSLLHTHDTPPCVLSCLTHAHYTPPHMLNLTYEHCTPQAHFTPLSRVQSWKYTLYCDGLCPFLKIKLAQLFHSEIILMNRELASQFPTVLYLHTPPKLTYHMIIFKT